MSHLRLSPNKVLILVGAILLGLYIAFFAIPFYLPRYCAVPIMPRELSFMPGELPFFFDIPEYHGPPLAVFILATTAIGYIYWVLLERFRTPSPSIRIVVIFAILFSLTLSLSYPVMSNDIFKYAFNGRILAIYHANPFLTTPDAFSNDPYLPLVYWHNRLSAYGPIWRWMEASSALLAPGNCLATILTLKGWSISFFLADTALVYAILRRTHPEKAVLGTMIFAWNPLIVIESAVNGHNDSVLVFFLLLAVYLALTRKYLWVIPALVLSVLIKPVTIILIPIFALYVLKELENTKQRLQVALGAAALSIVIVTALYLPFWQGIETLKGLARENWIGGSLAALVYEIMSRLGVNSNPARNITQVLFLLPFGLIYARELIAILRRKSGNIALSTFSILFWYLVLASFWFLPWYLLWLVAVVALLPQQINLVRLSAIFIMLTLIAYPLHFVEWVAVPLVFGPMLYLAYKYRHDFVQEAVP
ncbi:MAG: glycosyltransferase family 39 protein [Chloroflexi bacterium]|nr:glycosyltransferase family 39 protein [Chloroflexota bacterium]